MALTWTDINSITRDYIAPMLVDVVYKASALFVKAKSNNVVRFEGGNRILQPLMWAELNGGAFQRGQPFDTTYVQTDTAEFKKLRPLSGNTGNSFQFCY